MDDEQRTQAVFGMFDGVVSVVGFVFGLLIHHSPTAAVAVGGLGGAISATISMGTGTFEATEGTTRRKLRDAVAMGVATIIGSLVPVWPFWIFDRNTALGVGSAGCLLVAGWIGHEKRAGMKGYATAYLTLLGAVALTLLIVGLIPEGAA
jgi:VIT1/CCC1 family predicted Fe2+/Mn2+ transporter